MPFLMKQKVTTPIGEGVYQGAYRAVLGTGEKCLVRLPVNQETVTHLQDENCLTPRAHISALFSFEPGQLI